MPSGFDYYVLFQCMVADGKTPDPETFIALMRSARSQLNDVEYVTLNADIRAVLNADGMVD